MRKFLTAIVAALFLILAPATAHATSDGPTPYDVTTTGIQLRGDDTFRENGHVNVRYFDPSGVEQSSGIHFDPLNNQPGGAWIGESFIPWSAFGIGDGSKIIWVQVSHHNAHYGEGGQKPTPVGPKPDPSSETRTDETVERDEITQCPTEDNAYGTVTETTATYLVTEERTSTIVWSADLQDWTEVWGDWTETEREVLEETETTREMTDAEYEACGMPPMGAGPVTTIGAIAAVLLIGGTAAMIAARRKA